MTDLNEVCITGTLVREPVLRRTKTEDDMCALQVCVNRPEPSKSHDYLDVVFWEDIARDVANTYHAGDRILLKGRLRKNVYTGMDGRKHATTQIIAAHVESAEEEYPEIMAESVAVPVYAESAA